MKSGLGVRSELFGAIERLKPDFGFLEAHSENYFGESIARAKLLALREHYAVSLHGVGLSLGRADDLDSEHLNQLKGLVDDVDPLFVSEHLAWSAYSHRHVPDLLPLPLTETALQVMCEHVDRMQSGLERQILVENPSNYLLFDQLQIPEPEFLNELARRTGCGLLVDINNVHVSATNISRDARDYIRALNAEVIGQYHLAGYTEVERTVADIAESLLIDTHNQPVYPPVWDLFEFVLSEHGARPTLLEWDSDFPDFSVLEGECDKANKYLESYDIVTIDTDRKAVTAVVSQADDLPAHQSHFLDALLSVKPVFDLAKDAHQHRVWVYQNNVFAALQDYLKEVYPATCGVVGADFFKQLAQSYIQLIPPDKGNIHLYGDNFADVLHRFEGLNELPYLADVVVYEWALHSAYYASVSNILQLSEIDQSALLQMPVQLNDSVNVIRSDYPVFEIHRQSLPEHKGNVSINLSDSQDNILVFKSGYEVMCRNVDPEHAIFIDQLRKSENLLQAINALQGSIREEVLSSALALVLECQLLAEVVE